MLGTLDINASGLRAQRLRLDTIAQNVANATTTRDKNGLPNPYRRKFVVMAPGQPEDPAKPGVRIKAVETDMGPLTRKYEPGSKDADAQGYVNYPNVELSTEYVNALEASRAYEANVTMMETTKAMFNASLRLLA